MSRATVPQRRASGFADTIDWLGGDRHGANVLTAARALLALENALQKLLPPALAQACRVARMENQQVTLVVPSAAYAARLRQIAPSTAARLVNSGWNLTEIQVKVQAGLSQSQTKTSLPRQSIPLDSQAIDAFRDLQDNLQPGPLAEAVARLVMRHSQG